MIASPRKILFIRRDNVGDLICSTPAIRALRDRFPEATIGLLANTYNAAAAYGNPDIDELYVYQKEKHVPGRSRLGVWWANLGLMRDIRAMRYDVSISGGLYSKTNARYARMAGAHVRIGYVPPGGAAHMNQPIEQHCENVHEVIRTFDLLNPLGITGEPGPMHLYPAQSEMDAFESFARGRRRPGRPLVAFCLSVRMPQNDWPLHRFIAVMKAIKDSADPLVLWAPGRPDDPVFPGDDHKAGRVQAELGGAAIAYRTPTLGALIAAIAGADIVLTLDTGSLHMAAALRKPTVALMTTFKSGVWYPWMTRHKVLHAGELVGAIGVDEATEALRGFIADFD